MGGPAVELLPAGWVLLLLGSAAATAQNWEHASVSVEKVFCESLLVPVKHYFISQYNQLHITGCQGYNTVSQCWIFVETLANYSCSRTNCLLMWNSMVPSPCSQKPDNGPHPEPAETSTYFHILFLSDPF